jgi:hypothetical protein
MGLGRTRGRPGRHGCPRARHRAALPVVLDHGVAILVDGAASSVAGGVMYDASPDLSAGTEMRQIVRGDVHEGVSTRESVREPNARLHAEQTTARTDALLRARPTTSPPLTPIAGWSLLGITTFVVISQPWFLAHSANGHDSALRDTGLVILIGLVWDQDRHRRRTPSHGRGTGDTGRPRTPTRWSGRSTRPNGPSHRGDDLWRDHNRPVSRRWRASDPRELQRREPGTTGP